MTNNILITKNDESNSFALLKKFSQKVRSSGIVQRVKSIRYNQRKPSSFKQKKETLRKIMKKEIIERNLKLGKK